MMLPKIQFVAEPNVSLPLPPPKEDAPTESREKPIAVTTVEDTIGVISLNPVFCQQSENTFDDTADNDGSDNGIIAIGDAQIGKDRNKGKTDPHDDRKTGSNLVEDREQLDQCTNTGDQHG